MSWGRPRPSYPPHVTSGPQSTPSLSTLNTYLTIFQHQILTLSSSTFPASVMIVSVHNLSQVLAMENVERKILFFFVLGVWIKFSISLLNWITKRDVPFQMMSNRAPHTVALRRINWWKLRLPQLGEELL